MSSMLVRGKWIIYGSGRNRKVIKDGAILVEDNIIRDIGKYLQLSKDYSFDLNLGSDNDVVIPGLVNAHVHGRGLSAFQAGVSDNPLELWLQDLIHTYKTDSYWDTLLSAVDMIKSGITCVLCHWCERDSAAESYREDLEKTIKAFLRSGMRVAFAPAISDQNRYAYLEEERIIAGLPKDKGRNLEYQHDNPLRIKNYFDAFDSISKEYRNQEERIKFQYGPMGVQWCSDDLLEEIKKKAMKKDARVHLHLLETKYQSKYGHRVFGKSLVSHLEEIGFLDLNLSFAHGVWVSNEDSTLLSNNGAICVHNPSSNLRLHSGISPVHTLLKNGVKIGLGTDSNGLNDDEDIIQEMRLCWLLHRLPGVSTRGLSSNQVWDMATTIGAEATGFAELIGSIEIGKKADLVLVDIRRASSPYISSRIPMLDFLLQRITKSDVDTVIIDGEVVLENGQMKNVNRNEVIERLMKSFTEEKIEELDFVRYLKQALRQFWNNENSRKEHSEYEYNLR